MQLPKDGACHGRGREFESRRPRHSFQKGCKDFVETIEDPKGHVFVPFFVSLLASSFLDVLISHSATPPDGGCEVLFASTGNTNDQTAA